MEKSVVSDKHEFINCLENSLIDPEIENYRFNYYFELGKKVYQDFKIKNLQCNNSMISFVNCDFSKGFSFSEYALNLLDITFENCTFSSVSFTKELVDIKIRFYSCHFGNTNSAKECFDFYNITFKKLISFWDSTFHSKISFFQTNFENNITFSAATFEQNVLFPYASFHKNIIFRGTVFKKGLDLSMALQSGVYNFFDTAINLDDFESKNTQDEKSYSSAIDNYDIPTINKRETFRIIKEHYYKIEDNLKAVEFSKYEKETIKEILIAEKKEKLRSWDSLKIYKEGLLQFYKVCWDQYRFDLLALNLNSFSNDNRNSYWLGIRFTFLVLAISIFLSLVSMHRHFISCPEDLKLLINYLNPTHKPIQLDGVKPTWLFLIIETLTRIFIGYGIYQTIQAFRKLK